MRSPSFAFDLRASLANELQIALAELREAPISPKAVHKCRVHLKRARALARVGRACAPGLAAVFNESARSVMRTLSAARDLTALADTARALAAFSSRKRAAALTDIADQLDAARAVLPPPRWDSVRAGVRDLLALANVWPEASERQIVRGVNRVARRAKNACDSGRGARVPARRHQWRKREKDRFYVADILDSAWPHDRPRRRGRGAALGHALGQERDLLLLMEKLESSPELAGGRKRAKQAQSVLQKRRKRLAKRADRIGAQVHAGGA
jgi:CHAD domain-containing protein